MQTPKTLSLSISPLRSLQLSLCLSQHTLALFNPLTLSLPLLPASRLDIFSTQYKYTNTNSLFLPLTRILFRSQVGTRQVTQALEHSVLSLFHPNTYTHLTPQTFYPIIVCSVVHLAFFAFFSTSWTFSSRHFAGHEERGSKEKIFASKTLFTISGILHSSKKL